MASTREPIVRCVAFMVYIVRELADGASGPEEMLERIDALVSSVAADLDAPLAEVDRAVAEIRDRFAPEAGPEREPLHIKTLSRRASFVGLFERVVVGPFMHTDSEGAPWVELCEITEQGAIFLGEFDTSWTRDDLRAAEDPELGPRRYRAVVRLETGEPVSADFDLRDPRHLHGRRRR